MKQFIIGAAGFGVLAGSALGLAGTAAASTADTIVNGLRADGYLVSINQTPTAPLTACTVSNVSKVAGVDSASAFVDVICPDGC